MIRALWDLYQCPMGLTFKEKLLLVWYFANTESEYTCDDQKKAEVLLPVRKTFAQYDERGDRFENRRHAIPYSVDEQDVCALETFDGEIDDTEISSDTAAKIDELIAACKKLQLKVTEYFGDAQQYEVYPYTT